MNFIWSTLGWKCDCNLRVRPLCFANQWISQDTWAWVTNQSMWKYIFTGLECNISNIRTSVSSCFQTLRTEVEKRGAAEFFNESSRCLETWSNTSASVWYNFSNKYVLQEKTKEKVWLIYASVSSCFQTRYACDFPLS